MSKLIDGKIKAGNSCPFLYCCTLRTQSCPTPASPHPVPFACGLARKFDMDTPKTLDEKIQELWDLSGANVFIEYYYHLNGDAYKIKNPFTPFAENKIVLCRVDEGIEKAVDLALKAIKERKIEYEREYSERGNALLVSDRQN